MNYFLDIRVLPDPEFKETQLMNALFAKLHRALGKYGDGKIGVSFPRHGKNLGDVLRLHGTQSELNQLMDVNWLTGMRDYTLISGVESIPEQVAYRTVSRVQRKSAHNKRKRSVAKGWLTVEEAFRQIPETAQKTMELPYAQLSSLSNRNVMRVYVEHGPLQEAPVEGEFSSYGLSDRATVPWF